MGTIGGVVCLIIALMFLWGAKTDICIYRILNNPNHPDYKAQVKYEWRMDRSIEHFVDYLFSFWFCLGLAGVFAAMAFACFTTGSLPK
jgi:uncharacterized membrane protein